MGHHTHTIIKNSCLKVPIDPINRLPLASYERYARHDTESKRMTPHSDNNGEGNKNSLSLGDFYKSIPDYNDVNHLSNQEFYMKLENLRENKQKLLLKNENDKITEWDIRDGRGMKDSSASSSNKNFTIKRRDRRISKTDKYDRIAEKYINSKNITESVMSDVDSMLSLDNRKMYSPADVLSDKERRKYSSSPKRISSGNKLKGKSISPALSVSWNNGFDDPLMFKNDDKYLNKFNDVKQTSIRNNDIYRKSYSVPTSPVKKLYSPLTTLTVPQPFKVYERHADNKLLARLKDYSRELEHMHMYYNKQPKNFKANPVPIESRIPLYEKILEDQELRRSISKLQSKAELEAQMKPFSFTEREEKWGLRDKMGCSRLYRSNPQLSLMTSPSESEFLRYKQFKAKPIPKNLFSNYIYEKMREDDFYRALNRKIRAEEMLKASALPPSMAKREKSEGRRSYSPCIKYHNNKELISTDGIRDGIKYKRRSRSRKKSRNMLKELIQDGELENSSCDTVINSCNDKNKQNELEEELKRIYGTNSNDTVASSSGYGSRARSAVDMSSINKSNLAAILRIETTKKKLEADFLKNLEEERYQSEMKWRDSVLRRKPAWKSIQYSHADDLAMRLQMRKDEERLKREQFLHEMELMYGRVHEQPLMFERCYNPRKGIKTKYDFKSVSESIMPKSKHRSNHDKRYLSSDTISRKVSINETAETIGDDIDDYIYKSDDDNDSIPKSDDEIIECIPEEFPK